MEFTEIWLRGTAPPVNAERERRIVNKHLIVFNIEQTIGITEILHVNAADGGSAPAPAFASVYVNLGRDAGVERREEVGLIRGLNEEVYGLRRRREREAPASSLIRRGRPAEHHLLPNKLFIKSQLAFCKHFTENKICKLISCESRPGVKGGRKEGEPADAPPC